MGLPKSVTEAMDTYTRDYDDYEVIRTNDAIITSDWELPDTDPNMLLLVRAFHEHYKIKKHFLVGDVVATDQQALNHWPHLWKDAVPEMSYKVGVKMVVDIIKWVLEYVDELIITKGNHDDRLAKGTKGEVNLEWLLDMAGIPMSNYAFAYIELATAPVLLAHPDNYSSDSLKLAQAIYNVTATDDGRKPHVVIAHTHQAQSGSSPDKLRECHALGCLRHPVKTQYQRTSVNRYPGWDRGFMMIKDGHFHPIVLGRTDLSFYLSRQEIPQGLR